MKISRLIACVLATMSLLVVAGCGPDPQTEALRQENAALRKAAEKRDTVPQPGDVPPEVLHPPTSSATPATTGTSSTAQVAPISAGKLPAPGPAPSSGSAIVAPGTLNGVKINLPVYPNATFSHQPGAQDHSTMSSTGVSIVLLESNDKLDPIVAFYSNRMADTHVDPHALIPHQPPSRSEAMQDKMRVVTLTDVKPDGGMRLVKVHEDVGRTYIELMEIDGNQPIPDSARVNLQGAAAAAQHKAEQDKANKAAAPANATSAGHATTGGTSGTADPLHPALLPGPGKP